MALDVSLDQLSFCAVLVLCGLLTVRIIIPPNKTPADRAWSRDSLILVRHTPVMNLGAALFSALVAYYALLALTTTPSSPSSSSSQPLLCPADADGRRRSPELFRWSRVTAASFAAMLVGAPLRTGAFAGLGRDFTYGLSRPAGGLVTSGLYAHLQHPSYTGMMLVAAALMATLLRLDGALACIVPSLPSLSSSLPLGGTAAEAWVELVRPWVAPAYYTLAALLSVHSLVKRVAQEEAMLRELFGKEWEAWHARTKRFIPFVF